MPGDEPVAGGAGEESLGLEHPRAPWEEDVEDPAAPRALLAVMFTDIVGSTELATLLGDKRWRELLEQHDKAIREQIARFEGREVDTAGDAFFATFGRPIQAVDCALESARAVRRLGLRIRAGIHMGECVVTPDKVRGVTVHIGARVAAKAGGDEVLVSSTVRDTLTGQGLTFEDRGEQTLKGVEGRWRIYAVEPRLRDNESDLPPLLEAEIPKPQKRPVWQRPRVIAAVTALAVLLGAGAFVLTRERGLSTVDADSVAVIDASSGAIQDAFPVGRRPAGVATSRDGVWVANSIDRTVSFVSRDGTAERRSRALGIGTGAIAVGPSAVWVANLDAQNISRLDPGTAGELPGGPVLTGNGLSAIAYGNGAVWVTNAVDGTVWRFEEKSGRKTLEVPVGASPRGIAVDRSAVWVTSETGGTVTRLDPASGAIGRVIQVGNGPGAVSVGAGAVWVANALDGTVSRVDPRAGTVAATIRVGEGPRSIAIAKRKVFVANETAGTVSVIDPASNRIADTIDVGNAPMGLATDGERVWMSVRGGIKRYQGGTLRFATGFPVETMDPAAASGQFANAVFPATHDGLLSFKRVGGTEGSQLLPNLAEELRPPTDGGKTWSFTLREGLRYSDGTPVKASDVRHSIERNFTADQGLGFALFSVIEGAERCGLDGCDLSRGIVTNDEARSVVFHLRASLFDFPYHLALPIASIVPGTTPKANVGFTPVPGTGPYRFTIMTSTSVVLERNPYFRSRGPAQPDGYADRIEISYGSGDPKTNVDAVIAGTKDFTIDLLEPDIPVEEVINQVPAQVHIYDLQSLLYAIMNPRIPPFNDIRVRQAINFAVDRKALAEVLGAPLLADHTCQILTKNLVGYIPYCPYTLDPNPSGVWHGPDLAKARALVRAAGMAGRRVTISVEEGREQRIAMAKIIIDALNKIGLRGRLETVAFGYTVDLLLQGNDDIQMAIEGWAVDYPGAGSFFLPLLTCPDFFGKITGNPEASFNLARFCSPEIDRMVGEALTKQSDDLIGSIRSWAAVDKRVTDLAPWIPMATIRIANLVSARVGNVLSNPTLGPLITQMWLTDRK